MARMSNKHDMIITDLYKAPLKTRAGKTKNYSVKQIMVKEKPRYPGQTDLKFLMLLVSKTDDSFKLLHADAIGFCGEIGPWSHALKITELELP